MVTFGERLVFVFMIFFSNGQFYRNAIGSSIQPHLYQAVPVDQVHVNVSIFEMAFALIASQIF